MRVLLVEDDEGVAGALAEGLGTYGRGTHHVRRGQDALIAHHQADAILLDLGLPDCDGIDLLIMLRKVTTIPVLVLTARGDERTVVRALHLGADDFLTKPVGMPVLVARLDAVTRRARAQPDPAPRYITVDDITIDTVGRHVRRAGKPIMLTPKEFDLLARLATRAGVAVSREQLMDEIWGDAFLTISRSLDQHVAQVRAKLGQPGVITTIRGFGYRFGR